MEFSVTGEVIEWRGPAPFLFLPLAVDESDLLFELLGQLSYGWGCIPATVTIGSTTFTTSLMPRQGRFLVPSRWWCSAPKESPSVRGWRPRSRSPTPEAGAST